EHDPVLGTGQFVGQPHAEQVFLLRGDAAGRGEGQEHDAVLVVDVHPSAVALGADVGVDRHLEPPTLGVDGLQGVDEGLRHVKARESGLASIGHVDLRSGVKDQESLAPKAASWSATSRLAVASVMYSTVRK